MRLDIPFLSASPLPHPNISITPIFNFPFIRCSLFSICWQLHFDAAVKNDSIFLFGDIVSSETSTENR